MESLSIEGGLGSLGGLDNDSVGDLGMAMGGGLLGRGGSSLRPDMGVTFLPFLVGILLGPVFFELFLGGLLGGISLLPILSSFSSAISSNYQ